MTKLTYTLLLIEIVHCFLLYTCSKLVERMLSQERELQSSETTVAGQRDNAPATTGATITVSNDQNQSQDKAGGACCAN